MLHCPINDNHHKPHFNYDEPQFHSSHFHFPKSEPFFKKDHFGTEEAYGHPYIDTPLGPDPMKDSYFTPTNERSVDMDKQEIFDYLRDLKRELAVSDHSRRTGVRQELFVTAVNALTHPKKDVVLIQMGQESVLRCVDSAIADLDVDFLNIGIIFLLQIYKPKDATTNKDPTLSCLDRKVMKVLNRRHKQSSEAIAKYSQDLPAPTLREDAIYLGNEFRRTFMNLVFEVRFQFLRKLRNEVKGKDLKAKSTPKVVTKKNEFRYQDRALTCCPGNFCDPPKTPFYKPAGGFWMTPIGEQFY